MALRTNLFWKTLFLILIPLVFEIIFVSLLISLSKRADLLARRLQDSQRMLAAANRSLKASVELGLEVAFFISSDQHSSGFSKLVKRAKNNMQLEIDSLQSFSSKYPSRELSSLLEELRCLIDKTLAMGKSARESLTESSKDSAFEQKTELDRTLKKIAFYSRQQPYLIRAANATEAFVAREKELSGQISAREKSLRQISQLLLAVGILSNIVIAVWINREFNRHIMQRVALLLENAASIAAGKELLQSAPSFDEIGKLDVALHKLDDELRTARESEKAVFRNALDLICSISEAYLFVQLSPSCLRHLGISNELLAGRNCLESCFAQIDRSSLDNCLTEAKSSNTGASSELALRSDTGEPVYFICSALWSAEESNYFCVFHNISERKKLEKTLLASQERMNQLADSMPAGLLVLESGDTIYSINEFLCQLLNTNKEQLVGESAAKVFQAESYLKLNSALESSGTVEKLYNDMELLGPNAHSNIPVEVLLSPYESGSGSARIAVIQDMREEIEVEKLKREFLATLTHDIRTPLSSARSSLAVLETGRFGDPAEYRRDLELAEKSASEIIALINGVLELARLNSNKAIEKNETIELSELCNELVEEQSAGRSIRIIKNYQAGDKYFCHGNLPLLSKMLAIFLERAVRRSPENTSPEICISKVPDYLRIEIADKGPSLEEPERNLIIHGAGRVNDLNDELNLSIAQAISQGHGGNIILDELPEGRNALVLLLPSFAPETNEA